MPIAPGVYFRTIEVPVFQLANPGPRALFLVASPRGPEKLTLVGNREQALYRYGTPFFRKYGPSYHNALLWLSLSSAYLLRLLPSDATLANAALVVVPLLENTSDATDKIPGDGQTHTDYQVSQNGVGRYRYTFRIMSIENLHGADEAVSQVSNVFAGFAGDLSNQTNILPAAIWYAIGRGDDYNKVAIQLTKSVSYNDGIVCSVWDQDENGAEFVYKEIEPCAFDKNAIIEGLAAYMGYQIERFASDLINYAQDDDFYNFTQNPAQVNSVFTNLIFTVWDPDTSSWVDKDSVTINDIVDTVNYIMTNFDGLSEPKFNFQNGSEGSLITSQGYLDRTVFHGLCVQALNGDIDPMVKDIEYIDYYTIIDPTDDVGRAVDPSGWLAVKQTAGLLGKFRASIGGGIIFHADLGDHRTLSGIQGALTIIGTALSSDVIAAYVGYTKMYDEYSLSAIDVPPVTHLSYIIPWLHMNYGPFYPVAGSRYARLELAQDVYYTPLTLAEREELTLSNVNYIIKAREGIYFDLQHTQNPTYGPLTYINIAYLVIYFRHDLRTLLKPYIHDLDLPQVINAIERDANNLIAYWRDRGGIYSGEFSIYKDEASARMPKYNVKCKIYPTREIEVIDVTLIVY